MKKFPIKIKEKVVCHIDFWCPYFGKGDLAIFSKGLSGKKNHSEPNSYGFKREDLIGTEERNFMLDEYEVFLIN